ncbi:uncharacterized protein BJ171DRAFT_535102 [Polychytrium aggregatum]|uniref:uncharacterized protein n=1 Tax=Polychytrium aggregatum TaxID=110093 RepID=UPI0022FDC3FF|nr:uncharacterized protein BJ171DRAFT_535102 [Polychytrium aggregatum]KAI9193042.1 hypothetical protein BJ171DRAFT_535102 [Polychytrium aggregatum]
MTVTKPSSLKLTYFDSPGRAEAIRLTLFIGGVEFEDERLTREQFAAIKPTLPFGQLPVLTVDGEHVVAQSDALLHYAGILSGLYPSNDDPFACLLTEQALGQLGDMAAKLVEVFHCPDPASMAAACNKLATEVYPPMLAGLDNVLAKYSGKYSVGDKITIADVTLYHLVNMVSGPAPLIPFMPADLVAPYIHITKVYDTVKSHPRVIEWQAKNAARKQ